MSCTHFPRLSNDELNNALASFEQVCNDIPTQDLGDWNSVSKRNTTLRIVRKCWIPKDHIISKADISISQDEIHPDEIESDPDIIPVRQDADSELKVEYDIAYSLSYQVPVLYLTLHGPTKQPVLDLDKVYQYIVPLTFKAHLKDNDILGAISSTYHPDTGFPVFTINPCQTADAMSKLNCSISLLDYLLAWFGLIGGAVGLHVPTAVAQRCLTQSTTP